MKDLAARYIDLLKKALVNDLQIELEAKLVYAMLCASHDEVPNLDQMRAMGAEAGLLQHLAALKQTGETLLLKGLDHQGVSRPDPKLRRYTQLAHCHLGSECMEHLQSCTQLLLSEDVEGDLLLTGSLTGGVGVFLKGILQAFESQGRSVWLAADWRWAQAVSGSVQDGFSPRHGKQTVIELFKRYGLMDQTVRFLEGALAESLQDRPTGPLALMHVDATQGREVLASLRCCYDRISPGGFIIVQHYGRLAGCREAVDSFLAERELSVRLDRAGRGFAVWRR